MLQNVVEYLLVAIFVLLDCASSGAATQVQIRVNNENMSYVRHLSFNDGWRFFQGEAEGAEKPDFDDSRWREVRLPHDWSIEGPFDSKLNPHTGALPVSGTGWYRKSFDLIMP